MRSSKEESASCEEMALRNGILNKNALIVPLKESIIKAITLPPQDHVSGRVMAYKGGKTKCYITTELKTHCKSLCVRAFGRFAR